MLTLYRLRDGNWLIHTTHGRRAFHGDLPKIKDKLLELGIPWTQIQIGVESLIMRRDDYAFFNLSRRFEFSARVAQEGPDFACKGVA